MVNFLDSYIRLKMFNGLTIDVVYYVNCVRYELQGILKKTVGSDYIVCRRNGENIIIPFFGKVVFNFMTDAGIQHMQYLYQ